MPLHIYKIQSSMVRLSAFDEHGHPRTLNLRNSGEIIYKVRKHAVDFITFGGHTTDHAKYIVENPRLIASTTVIRFIDEIKLRFPTMAK